MKTFLSDAVMNTVWSLFWLKDWLMDKGHKADRLEEVFGEWSPWLILLREFFQSK